GLGAAVLGELHACAPFLKSTGSRIKTTVGGLNTSTNLLPIAASSPRKPIVKSLRVCGLLEAVPDERIPVCDLPAEIEGAGASFDERDHFLVNFIRKASGGGMRSTQ